VLAGLGWSRRVLPPGPNGLLQRPFIAIAGLRRHPEYRAARLTKKEPSRPDGAKARVPLINHHDGKLVNCGAPYVLIRTLEPENRWLIPGAAAVEKGE
jgi:hypothetical protein